MVRQTVSGYKDAFWNTIKQYVPTALTTLVHFDLVTSLLGVCMKGYDQRWGQRLIFRDVQDFQIFITEWLIGKFWKQNSKWPLVKECFNLCGVSLKWNYAAIKSNIVKDN